MHKEQQSKDLLILNFSFVNYVLDYIFLSNTICVKDILKRNLCGAGEMPQQ